MMSPDFDAGGSRRTAFLRIGDERAARCLDAEALGDVLRHRLDLHAEPAARDHALGHGGRPTTSVTVSAGIAKAMPTLPPDGEKIAVLTPMTSPLRVEGRAAGIAAVHRRVDLQEVVIGTGADVAALPPR